MDLSILLQHAVSSSNPEVQKQAEAQIVTVMNTEPQTFMLSMANILATEALADGVRQGAAALISRNAFNLAPNGTELLWNQYSTDVTNSIRSLLLATLGSNSILARRGASDAISKIAVIDVPQGKWNELLTSLVNTAANVDNTYKKTAIMALGFVCTQFKQYRVAITNQQTEDIFAAILIGLTSQLDDVKIQALKALNPCIIYMKDIFGNQKYRQKTINVLLQSLLNPNLTQETLEVFIQYSKHYYAYLNEIITQLYTTSAQIIQSCGPFTITALELWHTIAQYYLNNKKSNIKNYIPIFVDDLVKRLLTCMMFCAKDDDNNIREAAYRTLFLICEICQSVCRETVSNFVCNVIVSDDWKQRQAATIAFSTITFTDNKIIVDWLQKSIDKFFGLLGDQDEFVVESTALGLAKILQNHSYVILKKNNSNAYIDCLTMLLRRKENIVNRALQALCKLTENLSKVECDLSKDVSSLLSIMTNFILQSSSNLNASTIQNASIIVLQLLQANKDQRIAAQYTQHITIECKKASAMDQNTRNKKSCLLAILHTALLTSEQDMDESQAKSIVDLIQNHFKSIQTVDQDGLYCIGGLAIRLKQKFYNYWTQLQPYVDHGLSLKNQPSTFKVCVGVICDICKCIGKHIPQKVDSYLQTFILQFQNQGDRNIKGPLISCIGDLIREAGTSQVVSRHLSNIMQIAQVSVLACYHLSQSADDVDYLEELKQVLIEYMECLCSGLSYSNVNVIPAVLDLAIEFIVATCKREANPTLNFFKKGLFLVFDIGSVLVAQSYYINQVKDRFSRAEFIQIFNSLREIDNLDQQIKTLYNYGRAIFGSLKIAGVKYM